MFAFSDLFFKMLKLMIHSQNLYLSNSVATTWKRFVHNGVEAILKLHLNFHGLFYEFSFFRRLKICMCNFTCLQKV